MPYLKKEIHRFPPGNPGSDPIHVGIVYPNTYPVAISSLGYQTVHRIAYEHPGVITHRIVLDSTDGLSYPSHTLEEQLEIRSLDAILVTCSFELDYFHLVRILDESGIPVLREKRKALPLVVVGGIAVTGNPEPFAEIADAVGIGDAETMLPGMMDDLLECHPILRDARFKTGREKIYELWSNRDGVYVPSLPVKTVVHASMPDLDAYPSYTPIISPAGVYGAKNLVNISDGCPAHCRFCMLSNIKSGNRERSLKKILENAGKFLPGEASVGLVSSRLSDHPDIVEVINSLANDGYTVSVSSLRILSTSAEILQALADAGAKTATFAPEHGSEKIRDLVNKSLTYDEIRASVGLAYGAGMSRVKLYFLTGFEEETGEDIDATTEFILKLYDDIGLSKRPGDNRLIIGLAPFVPKASTPFQRRPMENYQALKRKMRRVKYPLKNVPRIDIETESPRLAIIQGTLSVADRSISEHLDAMSRLRGSLRSTWEQVLKVHGDGPLVKVMAKRGKDSDLPWGFIRRPGSVINR